MRSKRQFRDKLFKLIWILFGKDRMRHPITNRVVNSIVLLKSISLVVYSRFSQLTQYWCIRHICQFWVLISKGIPTLSVSGRGQCCSTVTLENLSQNPPFWTVPEDTVPTNVHTSSYLRHRTVQYESFCHLDIGPARSAQRRISHDPSRKSQSQRTWAVVH